jgi:hypothetical protein
MMKQSYSLRAVLHQRFWASVWIAVQRSGRDKRARALLTQLSVALGYLLWLAATQLLRFHQSWKEMGPWTIAFDTAIYGSGVVAFSVIRWVHRKNHPTTLSLAVSPARTDDEVPGPAPSIQRYLAERAAILSSLVRRAASEIDLRRSAARHEATTRSNENQLLRKYCLWEKLESPELNLVCVADGEWTVHQQNDLVEWSEQLRILRWVLRLDSDLVPLEHFPRPDVRLASGIADPQRIPAAEMNVLNSWDVRSERDLARLYVARIAAELEVRGKYDVVCDNWARELRDELYGPSNDLLAGAMTISELADDALMLLAVIASARARYSDYLADQLGAEVAIPYTNWAGGQTDDECDEGR